MDTQSLNKFDDLLEPLGSHSAEFFLAASLYHAKKISFKRAAELAELSFDEFKSRLKEHFDTGYILSDEAVLNDIHSTDELLDD